MSDATRNVCITAVDGRIGYAIAKLILKDEKLRKNVASLTGLALQPDLAKVLKLKELGAKIVEHVPGRERNLVKDLKEMGCDTICLVPPSHKDKFDLTLELNSAAKKAGVKNVLLISSAGAEYATKEKQPRLREFIEIETAVLSTTSDPDAPLGQLSCVIRAGFSFEDIIIGCDLKALKEGSLPLPFGPNHKFAPVPGANVAIVAALVLVGQGKHGFDDHHRGQMMVVTGQTLLGGKEIAAVVSEAMDQTLEYEEISEAEAKRVFNSKFNGDPTEMEHILEYFSLIREGKTNYKATMAFYDVTGVGQVEPYNVTRAYAMIYLP